jgi:hypothetical protein
MKPLHQGEKSDIPLGKPLSFYFDAAAISSRIR